MVSRIPENQSAFSKGVFFIYLLFLIIQDLQLQEILGTIARSPYIFLTPLVFVFISIKSLRFFSYKLVNLFALYFFYSIALSIALLIYYLGFLQTDIHIYGENLITKFLKSGMYNFILILTLYNFIYILNHSTHSFIIKVLKAIVVTQLLIGVIQIFSPEALGFLKTPDLNTIDRLSILNSEPSTAYPQLLVSLVSYISFKFYSTGKLVLADLILSICTLVMLLLILSRGGLVTTLLCLLIIVVFSRQNFKAKLLTVIAGSLIAVPVALIIVNKVIPGLILDIEEFNSISTRSITFMSALKSLIVYPFGQGYSTYLLTFPEVLNETKNEVLAWLPVPLLSYEIDEMIITGRALTVKSGLLNEALYSGWAIIIFYFFFFKEAFLKMKIKNKTLLILLRFTFLFIIVNYLFVSSLETSYIILLPFALIERLYNEHQLAANLSTPTTK